MPFSNCIVSKGATRSIICDLQRQNYTFVSNELVDLFFQKKPYTLEDLYKIVDLDSHLILMEYYQFLLENEFIFLCDLDEIPLFPPINLVWDSPSEINNAIIDIENEIIDLKTVTNQLDDLGCHAVQIRFFKSYEISFYREVLNHFENSTNQSLELYIPFSSELNIDLLNELINNFKRIKILLIYDTVSTKLIKPSNENGMGTIFFVADNIVNKLNCGNINKDYFSFTMDHYTESQHHNTCLNRKISIDVDGNIKNCPSMKDNFGNIKDTTLEEAINKPHFKKYWNIKKDDISVCKDCEFRHICTDCRAYIENPQDITSKPLKCGYNPYTAEWQEWSVNPLKQKAIEYYKIKI